MKNPANWPNDPSYGYVASAKAGERESGQWQFYSFIPDRSPGAFVPQLNPGETAAGMSVDLAWRHTIGDDRVLISVLDSGIKWDEADLAEKAYLNLGELAAHPPLKADSSSCAPLDPAKPTEQLFDCNAGKRRVLLQCPPLVWVAQQGQGAVADEIDRSFVPCDQQ